MQPADLYSAGFFDSLGPGPYRSASKVVPHVVALLDPASVVDVGGGTGAWSRAFLEAGVADVVCIDGAYVDPGHLEVPPSAFIAADLREALKLDRRFDLAVCLEVAEHLPAGRAESLIADLVALAPAVLFSAAIPGQGGTGHINEQWADYWAQRFAAHGYQLVDCIRPLVWDDPEVDFWYAQNSFLYVDKERIADVLATAVTGAPTMPLRVAHPGLVRQLVTRPPSALAYVSSRLPRLWRGRRG